MLSASDRSATLLRHLTGKLRFRHLQLLVTLREAGSLHAAARQLNLTQPSLSKALAEIEIAFDIPLFTRSARGLLPTPAGEVVVQGAARLLHELAHLATESSITPATTVIRIGAPPFAALGHLPDLCNRLAQTRPEVRVQIREGSVPDLIQDLLDNRLDALVSSYSREVSELPGQPLRYEKLLDTHFVVVAANNHRLAQNQRVSWTQLQNERWILPGQASMLKRLIDDVFSRAGLLTPVPAIESASPSTNLRLVAAGLGVAVVPLEVLRHAKAHAGEVSQLHADPPLATWPVGLIYHNTRAEDPAVRSLRMVLAHTE